MKTSPLDVSGLNLRLTRQEIVEIVRAGRKSKPGVALSQRPRRKANHV